MKKDNTWQYYQDNTWNPLPVEIINDIVKKQINHELIYYDIKTTYNGNILSAKWGGHPFGKHSLMLMNAKGIVTSILIHTNGELILEEKELLHYLAEIITQPANSSWDDYLQKNTHLAQMKTISDFVNQPTNTNYQATKSSAFYKLAKNIPLTPTEKNLIPEFYYIAAKNYNNILKKEPIYLSQEDIDTLKKYNIVFDKYIKNSLFGIFTDVKTYEVSMDKAARWYTSLNNAWNNLTTLRKEFDLYFTHNKIKNPIEKQKIAYRLLKSRRNLKKISPLDTSLTFND
jgi:hypothetical protein